MNNNVLLKSANDAVNELAQLTGIDKAVLSLGGQLKIEFNNSTFNGQDIDIKKRASIVTHLMGKFGITNHPLSVSINIDKKLNRVTFCWELLVSSEFEIGKQNGTN